MNGRTNGLNFEGTWQLTIATPVGKQHATLELVGDGQGLRGVVTSNDETMPLQHLVIDNNQLTWTVTMAKPIRLNLAFEVTVEGNEMIGHSKAGRFPRSRVSGRRVTEEELR